MNQENNKSSKSLEELYSRIAEFSRSGNYRLGQVGILKEPRKIVFFKADDTEEIRYSIPVSELQTSDKQILWLHHIAGKGFVTDKVLNEFLECLELLGLKPEGQILE